ncbi:hypothetical protein SLE2022_240160 [Rubroshorea leprosula]
MGKNGLYINVPNVFRCPISMDVMKSPVSLCTGITYDRSSIQHWLESGHDTCPATMQVLSSKDFVPNLTLHRLINMWVQSSTRRPESESSAISEEVVKVLMEKIERESCVDSLSKVVELVSSCEDNQRFLVRFGGFIEVISGVLKKKCVEMEALELVVSVFDSILSETGIKERLNGLILKSNQESDCISSIISILPSGNLKSQIQSVRLLESIAIDVESKRKIAESSEFFPILLNLIRTSADPSLNDTVSSLLITVAVTPKAKSQLVQNGIVSILSSTITDQNNKNHDKAMKLLAAVSSCSEGRLAIREDSKCAAGIANRLLKVSKTAAEDGVTVLWSMCCTYKDERVKEALVKSDAVAKLLLVMQREGEEGVVRRRCADLIKAVMAGCKGEYLAGYQTKTTHIMPC